ncbi:hypothetical protein PRIPAC_91337 [Pristionchus pacificus]|uniref:Uncharacterized protein n=1 Tax=Pristionchus pacificus TaxID=54126 RepID=A0A2A6CW76_PRIPA|nr:hypothetical protein PRIPAC_91337 [Pristionchus pacificus]|eukprot:PDM82336.1 hypothetical protein PRIPAC_36729 [Pristionchus pacificus]
MLTLHTLGSSAHRSTRTTNRRIHVSTGTLTLARTNLPSEFGENGKGEADHPISNALIAVVLVRLHQFAIERANDTPGGAGGGSGVD